MTNNTPTTLPATGSLLFAFCLSVQSATFGQCGSYSVQIAYGPDCGILGHVPANPFGLNELGVVTGASGTCGRIGYPFQWSSSSSVTLLSLGPDTIGGATAINSVGQIVGIKEGPTGHMGFLYQDGKTIDLGFLPGDEFAEAYSINKAGVVVGMSNVRGFRWQDGVMTELILPVGPSSVASDINDLGQICGWMGVDPTPPFHAEAFIWDQGSITPLGIPVGAFTTEATALNDKGDACGIIRLPNPNGGAFIRHGFVWLKGTMTDIGTLPRYVQSLAVDINDQGAVVGYCIGAGGTLPVGPTFIWQNGAMTPLDTLIPDLGITLIEPHGINNSGQIVCRARTDDNDIVMALLTPNPSLSGDFNCDHVVNTADLLGVINHWGFPNNPADFNHDGTVNFSDLLIVINNWGP